MSPAPAGQGKAPGAPPATEDSRGRATAGQLRRAGFAVVPDKTPNDATTGFEVVCDHDDEHAKAEFEQARKRGDAMPGEKGKPAG